MFGIGAMLVWLFFIVAARKYWQKLSRRGLTPAENDEPRPKPGF